MEKAKRAADGGLINLVLNRGNACMTNFKNDGDYDAFTCFLQLAAERNRTERPAWCLTPNRWLLIVNPSGGAGVVFSAGRYRRRIQVGELALAVLPRNLMILWCSILLYRAGLHPLIQQE